MLKVIFWIKKHIKNDIANTLKYVFLDFLFFFAIFGFKNKIEKGNKESHYHIEYGELYIDFIFV
jgi:hypothetical protein